MVEAHVERFVRESEEQIAELNEALVAFERDPGDEAAMERIFRTAHTLKGNCGAMGYDAASDLAHAIEDLLESIRAGRVYVTPELMDAVFAGVDELEAMVEEVAEHGEVHSDPGGVIEELREHAAAPGLTAPTDDEVATVLAQVAEPTHAGHRVYHVRLEVAGDPSTHGRALVDALEDAFDLLGTDPDRATIDAGDYDGTFDAVFTSVVDRDAVERALEPVDAVDTHVVTDATDRLDVAPADVGDGGADGTGDGAAETGDGAAEDAGTAEPGDHDAAASGSEASADDVRNSVEAADAEDRSVDELLEDDDVAQFDDLDELAEEVEGGVDLEEIGDAGTFDDVGLSADDVVLPGESDAGREPDAGADDAHAAGEAGTADGSAADDGAPASAAGATDARGEASDDEIQDATAEFQQLKEEVDPVGFDELQSEIEELEFDEYDSDDEVGFDELLSDDELHDDFEAGESADAATDADAGDPDSAGDEPSAAGSSAPTSSTDAESTAPGAEESAAATDDPAGDASEPAGDVAEPGGAAAESAGDAAEPAGDVAEPGGAAAESAGDAADPATDAGGQTEDSSVDAEAPPDAEDGMQVAADRGGLDADASDGDDSTTESAPGASDPARDATAADLFGGDQVDLESESVDAEADADDDSETDAPATDAGDEVEDVGARNSVLDLDGDATPAGPVDASDPADSEAAESALDEPGTVESGADDPEGDEPAPDSGSADEAADAAELEAADPGGDAETGEFDLDDADGGEDFDFAAEPVEADDEAFGSDDESFATEGTTFGAASDDEADAGEGTLDAVESAPEAEDDALDPDEDALDPGEDALDPDEEAIDADEDAGQSDAETDAEASHLEVEEVDLDDESASDLGDEPDSATGSVLGAVDASDGTGIGGGPGVGAFGGDDGDAPSAAVGPGGPGARGTVGDSVAAFGESVVEDPDEDRRERIGRLGVPARGDDGDGGGGSQSIRVDVEQLDGMLNLVEGLVTSRARLRRALEEGEPRPVIEDELDDLEDVTAELQDSVMDVRLVPLRDAVAKLPRTVRDVAREQDKDVDFELRGQDVELDRSIVDEIGDPLVHLVRNAVDHGIEPPAERSDAGKSETGSIELRARRERDRVFVTVEDDGRGIDPDDVRDAAVEDGDYDRDVVEAMDDEDVYDLLFEPGLTTAEEVTDVSGRGVGMDVVADTVSELEGSVSVDSALGEGTTVTLELPVRLAISDVLFLRVGEEEYGVPVAAVDEVGPVTGLEAQTRREALVGDGSGDGGGSGGGDGLAEDEAEQADDAATDDEPPDATPDDADGGEARQDDDPANDDPTDNDPADDDSADDDSADEDSADEDSADDDSAEDEERDESEREVIRLREALGVEGERGAGGMLVHLRDDVRAASLLCDTVRGQQEVVVKPFQGVLDAVPGIEGATVLGDGDVVAILDPETL